MGNNDHSQAAQAGTGTTSNTAATSTTPNPASDRTARRLVGLGVALVLAALLTGLAVPAFANPRMGLSSHLAGLSGGVLMIALGAAWRVVQLGPRSQTAALVLLAYGSIANWLTTLLAAAWNAGRKMPIATPAPTAAPWQEAVIDAGLISLSVAMVAGMGLVLWGVGMWRGRNC